MIEFKPGKGPASKDNRDLKLKDYIDKPKLITGLPASYNHDKLGITWGMLGNDQYGDCVIAGAGHETMIYTAEGIGTPVPMDANTTVADYHTICGSGDNGCDVRTVLGYRQKTGIHDTRKTLHKLTAYAAMDIDSEEVKLAVYYFSAVGIGIQFPASAMDQFNNKEPWSVVASSSIEGGHYIPIIGYDDKYLYCVTWGQIQPMTYDFFSKYCDEAWCIFSVEDLKNGVSVEGFNQAQLQSDLDNIHNKPSPTPGPVPTPTPTPIPPSVDVAKALLVLNAALKYTSVAKIKPYVQQAIHILGG